MYLPSTHVYVNCVAWWVASTKFCAHETVQLCPSARGWDAEIAPQSPGRVLSGREAGADMQGFAEQQMVLQSVGSALLHTGLEGEEESW